MEFDLIIIAFSHIKIWIHDMVEHYKMKHCTFIVSVLRNCHHFDEIFVTGLTGKGQLLVHPDDLSNLVSRYYDYLENNMLQSCGIVMI